MGSGDRFICETGQSIAVNQSKTGPPSTRFGFLCMHRPDLNLFVMCLQFITAYTVGQIHSVLLGVP